MTTESGLARGNWRELSIGYEEALARLPDALKKEGFGSSARRSASPIEPQPNAARAAKRSAVLIMTSQHRIPCRAAICPAS